MSLNLLLLLGFGIITGGVLSLVGGIKFFEFQRKARKQPYKQRRKRPVLFSSLAQQS